MAVSMFPQVICSAVEGGGIIWRVFIGVNRSLSGCAERWCIGAISFIVCDLMRVNGFLCVISLSRIRVEAGLGRPL